MNILQARLYRSIHPISPPFPENKRIICVWNASYILAITTWTKHYCPYIWKTTEGLRVRQCGNQSKYSDGSI